MVFNSITLDGYFTGENGDLSWAHRANDPEWNEFVGGNASGNGTLLMGRKTYDMMKAYWPTPQAKQNDQKVAEGMNRSKKVVFSRTLGDPGWENTRVVKNDIVDEVRRLKNESGEGLVLLGSGSIVAQLAQAGLVDAYTFVVVPVVIGKGRTMFEGVDNAPALQRTDVKTFRNGNVVLSYSAAPRA
jgi:dihydrofolate reductase